MIASPNPTLAGGSVQALRLVNHQSANYTATAGTIANAVGSSVVRVVATSDCYIAVGVSPTATTSDIYLPAGAIEYLRCVPGDKVSAVQALVAGTIHVTECD